MELRWGTLGTFIIKLCSFVMQRKISGRWWLIGELHALAAEAPGAHCLTSSKQPLQTMTLLAGAWESPAGKAPNFLRRIFICISPLLCGQATAGERQTWSLVDTSWGWAAQLRNLAWLSAWLLLEGIAAVSTQRREREVLQRSV